MFSESRESPSRKVIAEASVGRHPAHEFFTERYAWVRERMRRAVHHAQATGELGENLDVDAAVDLIIAAADGLQQQWLLDRSIDMVERLQRLWTGLAAVSHLAEHPGAVAAR
ncbi:MULTISPECIES: TetR family transcriptional regulator C-terminal domain-containing protein [Microbacterium]|uniref:TetR family transcriptional regulator C-terminal domain-containing protein n=1 Tax=Microbacterium TaxID=33882 RepID=UPI00217F06BC|nr:MULTISPECIES: hypothetical protein [Microbacterium]UWF77593.1 hypothetical protein JSY13_00405 [Microbacterium neungamense]WCM55764.1 hypothetical protein JRG78_00420 [Microbacterium sp. EF45047]